MKYSEDVKLFSPLFSWKTFKKFHPEANKKVLENLKILRRQENFFLSIFNMEKDKTTGS